MKQAVLHNLLCLILLRSKVDNLKNNRAVLELSKERMDKQPNRRTIGSIEPKDETSWSPKQCSEKNWLRGDR